MGCHPPPPPPQNLEHQRGSSDCPYSLVRESKRSSFQIFRVSSFWEACRKPPLPVELSQRRSAFPGEGLKALPELAVVKSTHLNHKPVVHAVVSRPGKVPRGIL